MMQPFMNGPGVYYADACSCCKACCRHSDQEEPTSLFKENTCHHTLVKSQQNACCENDVKPGFQQTSLYNCSRCAHLDEQSTSLTFMPSSRFFCTSSSDGPRTRLLRKQHGHGSTQHKQGLGVNVLWDNPIKCITRQQSSCISCAQHIVKGWRHNCLEHICLCGTSDSMSWWLTSPFGTN